MNIEYSFAIIVGLNSEGRKEKNISLKSLDSYHLAKSLYMAQPFEYAEEDSIPEDLLCEICSSPFEDPVEHPPVGAAACSQIYCRKCTLKQEKCPHCRHEVNQWTQVAITPSSQRFLYKPLQQLKVICPRCKNAVERGGLEAHLNDCGLGKYFFDWLAEQISTDCPLGCGAKVSPKNQLSHDKVCPEMVFDVSL